MHLRRIVYPRNLASLQDVNMAELISLPCPDIEVKRYRGESYINPRGMH
jgi:hypothetical protein